MKKKNLSQSMEDYLVTALYLSRLTGKVRISDIAKKLDISKPSASEAMEKLSQLGYVKRVKYKPISLTSKGKKVAQEIFCKHNVVKNFLIHHVGVKEDIAEKDAFKMEHIISDDTFEKICVILDEEKIFKKMICNCPLSTVINKCPLKN